MDEHRQYGDLRVGIFDTAKRLAEVAAEDFARIIGDAIPTDGSASVILATGNSQSDFIAAIRVHPSINWSAITVFHMDEYLGMSDSHPASFRRWAKENLLDHVEVAEFHGVRGDAPNVEAELQRYTNLLDEHSPVVCVLGIGENGHLAFNDPPADFETTDVIHVVDLDEKCRMQQVGEGHFADLSAVPSQAMSLTVHGLLRCDNVMALVPESRKAEPVKASIEGPVTPDMPASVLTTMNHAVLYLDRDSAALLS